MDRYDNEERQRRRNQGGSEKSYNSDRSSRFRDDDERYGMNDREGSDFDRYSRTRYGRSDNDSSRFGSESGGRYGNDSNRYQTSSDYGYGYREPDRWRSSYNQYNSSYDRSHPSERYNSGGSDRWEYRPSEDYRSLRDDSRFDRSSSFSSDSNSNLGGRQDFGRKDWDYDRTSSYPGYGSTQSSGYNSYGSGQYGSGQSFGSNYGSSGSQRQGYSGGFGQNSGYGTSGSGNQTYGSQSGSSNQSQSRWGSDSSSSFGNHSGKGPKGYKRSDERIKEEISDLLTSHHEVDPSEVEIKVSNCDVTLTGTVNSRYEKRMIEDLVQQIQGVSDVTNQLRVSSQDSSRSSSDGSQKSGQSQGFTGQSSSGQKEGSQQSSKSIQ